MQAVTSIGDAVDEKSWHLHHTYEALLWSGMLLCLVLAKPFAAGVPVNRPLAIVGKLSYSFYLVHVPILFCLIYPFKSAAGADAYQQSVGVWLLPLLTYRFLNLKKRIPS